MSDEFVNNRRISYEEANKSFSVSIQLSEVLNKSWRLWGDSLLREYEAEQKRRSTADETMRPVDAADELTASLLQRAFCCYVECGRYELEWRARKHVAKCVQLLFALCELAVTDESLRPQVTSLVRQHTHRITALNWLPWLAELCVALRKYNLLCIGELILYVARACPQATFYTLNALVPLTADVLQSYRRHLQDNLVVDEGETATNGVESAENNSTVTGRSSTGATSASSSVILTSLPTISNAPVEHTWTDLVRIVLVEIVKTAPADFTALRELLEEVCSL